MSTNISLCKKPTFPKARLTPLQQKGLTYERKVFKELLRLQKTDPSFPKGQLRHNQWFRIDAGSQTSFCCPDILLINCRYIYIFECKLTQTDCFEQLERYAEICKKFFSLPVVCIAVFRNLLRRENLLKNLSLVTTNANWHLYL